jgi:hypothetical protein
MSNLQDLINLAKADGGKFFVMDEEGNANLVIMSVEDYQNLLLGKLQRQVADVEDINREILQAQLETNEPVAPVQHQPAIKSPVVGQYQPVDLRSEVIDPTFDFEGPKIEIDDL